LTTNFEPRGSIDCSLALQQAEPAADKRGQALSEQRRFNLSASWVQGKARKTKEKPLDFLGLPWPKRDFSTSYGESK
jgi:hypothetical protein